MATGESGSTLAPASWERAWLLAGSVDERSASGSASGAAANRLELCDPRCQPQVVQAVVRWSGTPLPHLILPDPGAFSLNTRCLCRQCIAWDGGGASLFLQRAHGSRRGVRREADGASNDGVIIGQHAGWPSGAALCMYVHVGA